MWPRAETETKKPTKIYANELNWQAGKKAGGLAGWQEANEQERHKAVPKTGPRISAWPPAVCVFLPEHNDIIHYFSKFKYLPEHPPETKAIHLRQRPTANIRNYTRNRTVTFEGRLGPDWYSPRVRIVYGCRLACLWNWKWPRTATIIYFHIWVRNRLYHKSESAQEQRRRRGTPRTYIILPGERESEWNSNWSWSWNREYGRVVDNCSIQKYKPDYRKIALEEKFHTLWGNIPKRASIRNRRSKFVLREKADEWQDECRMNKVARRIGHHPPLSIVSSMAVNLVSGILSIL